MSVFATLTRALLATATVGCASPAAGQRPVLPESETVVGRAVAAGEIALLTDAPALLIVKPESGAVIRAALRSDPGQVLKLWGLGEVGDELFTISAFKELTILRRSNRSEISLGDRVQLAHPLANLFDTDAGMAGQHAVDDAGKPLAWNVDPAGVLSALDGAVRRSLDVSRAEEGLLHLLACSLPPSVVCWLPGSNQLLKVEASRLVPMPSLQGVAPVEPAVLLSKPEARVIKDAIAIGADAIAVLLNDSSDASRTAIAEFHPDGRLRRMLRAPEPARLLLASHENRILAISRSGVLMEVLR